MTRSEQAAGIRIDFRWSNALANEDSLRCLRETKQRTRKYKNKNKTKKLPSSQPRNGVQLTVTETATGPRTEDKSGVQ